MAAIVDRKRTASLREALWPGVARSQSAPPPSSTRASANHPSENATRATGDGRRAARVTARSISGTDSAMRGTNWRLSSFSYAACEWAFQGRHRLAVRLQHAARASAWPTQLLLRPSVLGLARQADPPSTKSGRPVSEFLRGQRRGSSVSSPASSRRKTPSVDLQFRLRCRLADRSRMRRPQVLPRSSCSRFTSRVPDGHLPGLPNPARGAPVASRSAALSSDGGGRRPLRWALSSPELEPNGDR